MNEPRDPRTSGEEEGPSGSAERPRRSAEPLWPTLLLCASPLALLPLLQYVALSPVGTSMLLWIEGLLALLLLPALGVMLVTPFLLISRGLRRGAARALACALVFTPSFVVGMLASAHLRHRAFEDLAERSMALVSAIEAFELAHGSPPPDLDALVPDFLPAVPGTGLGAHPRYDYHVGEAAVRFDQNPWAIVVSVPSGGINFDTFMYFPRQNYPVRGYGGGIQRIGKWAYVHE